MGLLECGAVPVLAGGEEHLLGAGDLGEELLRVAALSMAMRTGRKLSIPLKIGLAAIWRRLWRMPRRSSSLRMLLSTS